MNNRKQAGSDGKTDVRQDPATAPRTSGGKNAKEVEGEGSYTATHNYNEGVQESVQRGDTASLAEDAKEALDGEEGSELREAERRGKAGEIPRRQG